MSFTEPHLAGRNLSGGFDLYSYRYDFTQQAGYLSTSIGTGLRTGFPLSQYLSMSLHYNLHGDDVVVNNGYCNASTPLVSPILCAERGTSITSLIGYAVRWDHRNDPINPTRGFYTTLSQDFAGLGGTRKYIKTDLEGACAIAEQIRQALEALAIPHKGSSTAGVVTASFGVATMHCTKDRTFSEVVAAADKLLYAAISSGRNCVQCLAVMD